MLDRRNIHDTIPQSHPARLLLSVKEAASALGLSPRTIHSLIAAKQLPVRRIGRRVLIHHRDLEQFARRDHALSGGR
jgi:excisionase family DNA binding protein